jgi:DNA-binding protein Fis
MTKLFNKEEIFEIINSKENQMHFMIRMLEKAAIEEALYITRGNQTNAAILLGMVRITFRARCVEFGLIKSKRYEN